MKLWELKAALAIDQVEVVEDVLLERGDERWSVLQDALAPAAWVVGIFADQAEAEAAWAGLQPCLVGVDTVVARELPDQDWRESYKLHFKAWRCGRLHWVPTWERADYLLPEGDVAIWLDPGMAFGTGNHETTRLCCERLVAWAETASPESKVIDAGCGSGILALSAAVLGFRDILAFDNDAEAVRISEENAALNGQSGAVSFRLGDLVTGFGGEAGDLVLANIQADVLMRYVKELVNAVQPGGRLVLSGILASEQARVEDVFKGACPEWRIDGRVLGEWSDLELIRPN